MFLFEKGPSPDKLGKPNCWSCNASLSSVGHKRRHCFPDWIQSFFIFTTFLLLILHRSHCPFVLPLSPDHPFALAITIPSVFVLEGKREASSLSLVEVAVPASLLRLRLANFLSLFSLFTLRFHWSFFRVFSPSSIYFIFPWS